MVGFQFISYVHGSLGEHQLLLGYRSWINIVSPKAQRSGKPR